MRISDWSSERVLFRSLAAADLHARRGLLDERLGALIEQFVEAAAGDLLPADLQQDGHGQRRDSVEAAVADAPLHPAQHVAQPSDVGRSEEHTSELQSLMRNSYAVFLLNTKT